MENQVGPTFSINCNRAPGSRVVLLLSLLLVSGLSANKARSQGPAEDLSGASFMFQLDNDLFAGSDKNYTNGARVAYLYSLSAIKSNSLNNTLKNFGDSVAQTVEKKLQRDPAEAFTKYEIGFGVTQLMFTPKDPLLQEVPQGERPYASWLGLELSVHSKNNKVLRSALLSVGVTGEQTYAHETQDFVHNNISHSPLFQGWDNQTPEELTVNFHLDSKHHTKERTWSGIELDGYREWGLALGNFRTDAYVGSTFRLGWNLPLQYMTPRLQLGSYSHELFEPTESKEKKSWSLYGFASGRVNVVAHDVTLNGPWFSDWEDAVAPEIFVFEGILGFGLRWGWLTATYSRTFRSNEFEGQDGGHQFGSAQLAANFYF